MEAGANTCKLCLKFIQGIDMIALDDKILDKLDFIQMDLEHSVEEGNLLCTDCEEKIEYASDFKSFLVNSTGSAGSEVNMQNIPSTSTGETSAEKTVCHLCKNYVDKLSVISLTKLLKDDSMMEVFQGHIQEVDLKNLEEHLMVCVSCQKSLASFSTLVSTWSIANDWNEDDTKDDMDKFEMIDIKKEDLHDGDNSDSNMNYFETSVSNSATNASATIKGKGKQKQTTSVAGGSTSKKIKTEVDEISDSSESLSLNSEGVKKEEIEDIEESEKFENLQLKNEELDIKDEEGFTALRNNIGLAQKNENEAFICQQSSEWAHERVHKLRGKTKVLLLVQKISDTEVLKCNQCSFATIGKRNLKRHALLHKSVDEAEKFRCNFCTYVSNKKDSLKKHSVIHKIHDEIELFKCEQFSYIPKRKSNLESHSLKHTDTEDQDIFKCDQCPFVTVWKTSLKKHAVVHENRKNYRCDLCTFVSKRKDSLHRHTLVHKATNEVKSFKCDQCSFVTKRKHHLLNHSITHKEIDDIEESRKFRCSQCPFVTKWKSSLTNHTVIHLKN